MVSYDNNRKVTKTVCVYVCEARRTSGVLITVCLRPFRQGVSLNLEQSLQPAFSFVFLSLPPQHQHPHNHARLLMCILGI